ncbi:MAG: heterodisulfide reductase-related iron-sulfur binding cluster [Thermoplasmata archaeon]|nr:heterodisulfide reductase-related iron-sulfur binding cluster [Thermoplasmata archaeon]
MKRYTIYLGCMIPMRFPSIEKSARLVFEKLGAKIADLEGYTCCPDPVLTRLAEDEFSLALSARNLAMAEKMGNDLLVLCNGCYETLIEAEEALRDDDLRARVNGILANEGTRYLGKVKVRALIDVLNEDFRPGEIAAQLKAPRPVKVACHTGCHMLRSKLHPRDRVRILEDVAVASGAEIAAYGKELDCCGFPCAIADEKMAMDILISPKLEAIKSSGAEAIVTGCPTCLYQFENSEAALKKLGKETDIPVMHILELMALGFGFSPEELGLELHRSPVKTFAQKKWGDVPG